MTDLPEATQARIAELRAKLAAQVMAGRPYTGIIVNEAIDQAVQIVAEGTVSRSVYESAVRGRSDFREAFRRERDVLFRIQALIEDEIAGAEDTLKLDLTPQAQASASGWLNAAKGIKRGIDRLRGPDSNILPNAKLSASQRVVEAAKFHVDMWKAQKITGLPRAERNAVLEESRAELIASVEALAAGEKQGENDGR